METEMSETGTSKVLTEMAETGTSKVLMEMEIEMELELKAMMETESDVEREIQKQYYWDNIRDILLEGLESEEEEELPQDKVVPPEEEKEEKKERSPQPKKEEEDSSPQPKKEKEDSSPQPKKEKEEEDSSPQPKKEEEDSSPQPKKEEDSSPPKRYELGFFDPGALDYLPPDKKEVYGFRVSVNFDLRTMDLLSRRLFGVVENNRMKSVYLCVTRSSRGLGEERSLSNMSWILVNANERYKVECPNGVRRVISVSCVDDVMRNAESGFPSELSVLTGYGCAIWDSKIFIAGGISLGVSSNKVFIYDTVTKIWEPEPLYMELRRGEKPTLIILGDIMCIFCGVINGDYPPECTTHWVELYHFTSKLWLPMRRFPNVSKIYSHAVFRERVLLQLDGSRHCQLLRKNLLMSGDPVFVQFSHLPFTPYPYWNKQVVVFDPILLWHDHGTIYAHDPFCGATIPTYTLPCTGFSKVLFGDSVPASFLAHIGKGKLCLFYQVENRICYFTFLVQISQCPQATVPLLVLGDSGLLQNTIGCDIMHALEAPL